MRHASSQSLTDQFQVLFDAGTCTGLTDWELIDRFLSRRDEGGERAFGALVTRHGPMVMGVCRGMLADPSEVHDAFQATFLVLARRAGSIRKRGSIGSWLYGVAVRVAARERLSSIRRQIRERRTIEAVAAIATESADPSPIDCDEGEAVVHQEVDRLPEKYRAPIVLCYFEGLTHDEAAERLSWPVGSVRSRLSRARDRLRARLTRRGVTAPSTLGPLAAWLIADADASTASAASALPVHLSTITARSATQFAIGQGAGAGSLSTAALRLAQGALTTMMLKKLTIAGCVVLSIGILGIGGGALLVRVSRAQEPKPLAANESAQSTKPARVEAVKPDDIEPLLQQLLEAARRRVEAQRNFYQEGRITLDRYVDACIGLEKVELLASKTEGERQAVRQRLMDHLNQIERREADELQVGRGTVADLAEARQRRLEAELQIKLGEKEAAEKASILRRLGELERKVEDLSRERAGNGQRPGR
ncbi:MAG: RNA polymerase sigma factor [Isosphaeraceae bacterium]